MGIYIHRDILTHSLVLLEHYEYEVEQEDLPLDDDVRAHQENYISISPVHRDLTKEEMVAKIAGWGIQW